MALHLPKKFLDEVIAHAREEAPNECCGILAGKEGRVAHVYRAANALRSPIRYNMEPKDEFRILQDMDEKGWELLAIYHSHTHTQAYPSPTDVKLAYWPDALYLIVSLENPQQPVVRAFHIIQGQIDEEGIEVAE